MILQHCCRRMLPGSAVHNRWLASQQYAVNFASTPYRAISPRSRPAVVEESGPEQLMCRRQYLRVCIAQLLGYSCLWVPGAASARVQPPAPFNRDAGGGSQAPSRQLVEEPIGLQIADVRRLTEHAEAAATAGDYQQVRTRCLPGHLFSVGRRLHRLIA